MKSPRSTQLARHPDHLDLVLDGPLSGIGIRVGEVRRTAQHRHGEPRRGDRLPDAVQVSRIEAGEETLVHLQPFSGKVLGHFDPVENGHRALTGDCVEVALRKGG